MHTLEKKSDKKVKSNNTERLLNGLQFLWLELLQKCNLSCSHCYAESSPRGAKSSLTLEQWQSVLTEASQLGCRNVQFIGGEPLVYPHLDKLLTTADFLGYETIEIYTNGTLINDQMVKIFKNTGVRLALSFYSHDEETHDRIVGSKGSFSKRLAIGSWTRR